MANMLVVFEPLKHFKTTAYIIKKYISNILEPKKPSKSITLKAFIFFCAPYSTKLEPFACRFKNAI